MTRVRALHLLAGAAAALLLVVAIAGCGSSSAASRPKGSLQAWSPP